MGGTACPSHTKSISLAASLRNPFLADIIDTLLPPTWKGVTLDKYDVTTNLDEHIDNNVVQEGLFIMDDIVLCKVFLTLLKGQALSWFTQVPPNSIDYFKTLTMKFKIQFATSQLHI